MFTDLKPYPEYQVTVLDWPGGVPAHWQLKRLRYLFREVDVRSTTGTERLLSMSQRLGLVPAESVQRSLSAASSVGGKLCLPGDMVLNRLKAHLGVFAVSRQAGLVSPDYTVLRSIAATDPTYFEQLLRSEVFRAELRRRAKGIVEGFWRLYTDDFYDIVVPEPPADEQAAIVKYLGHANARIDRAIAAKRKLIALLEEQKQAIINRAVTRGLDPTIHLKDSRIPWLGQIPDHWQAMPLRRAWDVIDCKHLTVPFVEDGYPLASVVQAQRFILDLSDARRTGRDHYLSLIEGARRPHKGDLVYCRNVGVGSAAAVTIDEPFAMGQDVCLLRSADQDSIFMNHFLRSAPMSIQLDRLLVGSTFRRINVSQIRALVILMPPLTEQRQIVRQIESETARIDAVVARSTREIELLREFRMRLTADVVTGQVDIRAAAARLPELDLSYLMSDVIGSDEDDLDVEIAESLGQVDA